MRRASDRGLPWRMINTSSEHQAEVARTAELVRLKTDYLAIGCLHAAAAQYRDSPYEMNRLLRLEDAQVQGSPLVEELDALTRTSTLEQQITAYRGVVGVGFLGDLSTGSEFIERGYCSTTLDQHRTYTHLIGDKVSRPIAGLLIITLPVGTQCCLIAADGSEAEAELLLQRGSRFSVDAVTDGDIEGALGGWKARQFSAIKFIEMSYIRP